MFCAGRYTEGPVTLRISLDISSISLGKGSYSLRYMLKERHSTHKKAAENGFATVRQASRLIRIDEQNVYAAIWGKRLRAQKVRGRWCLSKQDVSRAMESLEGQIIREGSGHKGDPFRYRRNDSIRPSPHPKGSSMDESNLELEEEVIVVD